MPELIGIYQRMPYALRTLAASAHGYYLRQWRYGRETERMVEEALERDRWPRDKWQNWQEEHLAFLLHRAATQVPYYRQRWLQRRRHGDRSSPESLENWPILAREEARSNNSALVADDCDVRRMYGDHTSGTTGTPLRIWQTRATVQQLYALQEARIRRWHGVSYGDRWGIFGGQAVVPVWQQHPPYWVWNRGLNQLYFSAIHIAPWSAASYLDAIRRYELTHLIVYPSSLHALATELPAHSSTKLRVVFSNAEPMSDFQRERIEHVFGCPMRETYGQAETVCAASECEAGSLHWWPDAGFVEILDDDGEPVGARDAGRLVATGLLNPDMPLIRYDMRDMVQRTPGDEGCACGRRLPRIGRVIGRTSDVVATRDGRRIMLVGRIFGSAAHIKEGQIIQETLEQFRIKVVADREWSDADARFLAEALRRLVGDVAVDVECVSHIERTGAAKFKDIISRVTGTNATCEDDTAGCLEGQ